MLRPRKNNWDFLKGVKINISKIEKESFILINLWVFFAISEWVSHAVLRVLWIDLMCLRPDCLLSSRMLFKTCNKLGSILIYQQ